MRNNSLCPSLFVIILNWNRPDDTHRCLESVLQSNYNNLHPLLVDNGSRDDSIIQLRRHFPNAPLLCNDENLGYADGNNVGIYYALAQQAEYILLLNDDVVVEPDTFTHLIAAAMADDAIGAVGGQVRVLADPKRVWAIGEAIPRDVPLPLEDDLADDARFTQLHDIDYAVGCCILLRASVLREVGVLDGRFFAIHEEVEWCYRTRQAGYRVVYTPHAITYHDISHSFTSGYSPSYHYLYVRNQLILWQLKEYIPADWRRLHSAFIAWKQELQFIYTHGGSRIRCTWGATWGALAYLQQRYGAPPTIFSR